MKIAFLGAGAMGSRMASRLIQSGHSLNIYNRTSKSIYEKIKGDFKYFDKASDAVKDVEIVFSMLTDDFASKEVWFNDKTGAINLIRSGTLVIECSTLSSKWIMNLGEEVNNRGAEFLDAPVLGSLPQAQAGQLIFTIGGSVQSVERSEEILKVLGSKINHVGQIGAGTAVKLAANTYFAAQLVGLKEALEIAKIGDVDQKSLLDLFSEIPAMSPAMKGISQLILANDYSPRFTVELISKDLDYASQLKSQQTEFISCIKSTFDKAVSQGSGKENITAIFS